MISSRPIHFELLAIALVCSSLFSLVALVAMALKFGIGALTIPALAVAVALLAMKLGLPAASVSLRRRGEPVAALSALVVSGFATAMCCTAAFLFASEPPRPRPVMPQAHVMNDMRELIARKEAALRSLEQRANAEELSYAVWVSDQKRIAQLRTEIIDLRTRPAQHPAPAPAVAVSEPDVQVLQLLGAIAVVNELVGPIILLLLLKPEPVPAQIEPAPPPVPETPPPQEPAASVSTGRSGQLIAALQAYGVSGHVVNVQAGPVVTVYSVELASGVKASKALGLEDDVARIMRVKSAIARSDPERGVVCFDLANERRETVRLSTLLDSPEWLDPKLRLPLALGCNIDGSPRIEDLASMPHLLVAGTTGAGKSVGLNAMILSMLDRHGPDTLKMILIDPKRVELNVYENIPHLLTPIVKSPAAAVHALRWAVKEMERRYQLLEAARCRDLDRYNAATGAALPRIVVVIDEAANLMAVAKKAVEAAVSRLAAEARAAGVHIIMATQRPTVDVITGTIKENFPWRLAYKMTQREGSRTVIGECGAEKLLGGGDSLLLADGALRRVHGAYVSDDEVERKTAELQALGKPEPTAALSFEADDGETDGGESCESVAPECTSGAQRTAPREPDVEPQSTLDAYKAWLLAHLREPGAHNGVTVKTAARASGYPSMDTLYEAADELGVMRRNGKPKIWELPDALRAPSGDEDEAAA